jgi:PE-PGRS C-terminal aspartyl peptidase-like domain
MAGRHSTNKQSRNAGMRRRGAVIVGGSVGAFAAAAAMATGSAAPAKADIIDTLLDPIIQPLITSMTDALAGFDPAAATDLTSYTDSLLSSLNSIDLALPSAAEPAAAVPASDPTSGTYDIPITVMEGTEPTVQATVDGAPTTLLVDTGSSGLVIPETDLGSNSLTQLENLISLGMPSSIGESGYSGGVQYFYLEYNDVPTDYGNGALDTTGPVDVEIYSYNPSDPLSFLTNNAFQTFDQDNDVTGVLGIGDNTAGPTESPFQADGYPGVLVDINPQGTGGDLIVSPTNPDTPINGDSTVSGAPISSLYETVSNGGMVSGGSPVSDDVDSGGVYGTIPSTLASDVQPGSVITVYSSQGGTELYQYTVGSAGEEPTSTSGTSIDSGVLPFVGTPVYIDYANDTMTFDQ